MKRLTVGREQRLRTVQDLAELGLNVDAIANNFGKHFGFDRDDIAKDITELGGLHVLQPKSLPKNLDRQEEVVFENVFRAYAVARTEPEDAWGDNRLFSESLGRWLQVGKTVTLLEGVIKTLRILILPDMPASNRRVLMALFGRSPIRDVVEALLVGRGHMEWRNYLKEVRNGDLRVPKREQVLDDVTEMIVANYRSFILPQAPKKTGMIFESALSSLQPQMEKIIRMRFGCAPYLSEKSVEQVATELDISRDHVNRIEAVALQRLRETEQYKSLRLLMIPHTLHITVA